MDNKKLNVLRNSINLLDDKILDLLKERAEIVTEIGEYKKSNIAVVDIGREQKILDRLIQNSQIKYSKDSIVRIWREIFHASTKLQQDKESIIAAADANYIGFVFYQKSPRFINALEAKELRKIT